ncbi:MAG TPA: GreA/GreB family elongation factor [Solimonas sp.]
MSRAFVKEADADLPEMLPAKPLSPHPNRVTVRGLQQLRLQLEAVHRQFEHVRDSMHKAELTRERVWLEARLTSAVLMPPPADRLRVGFGARVTLLDDGGRRYRYQIVGEDEAVPEQGLISWVSPLASALEGAAVGDVVPWPRPAGDLDVEVCDILYE